MSANTSTCSCECIDAATRVLGDKWNPRIIYALSKGEDRFCALQRAVGGVNPRTLSNKLDYLERCGVVTKSIEDTANKTQYSLTTKGSALIPILQQMAAWNSEHAQ